MFGLHRPLPTAERIEAMALAAMERLPQQFREHLGNIVLQVEDFADAETLASVGVTSPHQLSGIYEGIPLDRKSISHSGAMPDRIRLFRIPACRNGARGAMSRSNSWSPMCLSTKLGTISASRTKPSTGWRTRRAIS
jgi:hypothetical protein